MNIFVDSSFFIALLRRNDLNHLKARTALEQIQEQEHSVLFYTSSYIIEEAATVLSMRVSKAKAIALLRAITREDFPLLLPIDEEVRVAAYQLFEQIKDKDISMVDCYSATLMKRHHLNHCFTFDKQFKKLGFKILE